MQLFPHKGNLFNVFYFWFAAAFAGDINTRGLQAGNNILTQNETVLADEADEVLAGIAAQARAFLAEPRHQANLIGSRPFSKHLAEGALLLRGVPDEVGVGEH